MTSPPDPSRAGDDVVRLRLDIAYDGTDFAGWATQPEQRTVQQTVEDAVGLVLRAPALRLVVAGRTDAGVHARGQVCHVDVPTAAVDGLELSRLARRLTRLLPDDVVLRGIRVAPTGFDARFSASWRRYRYRVCDDLAALDPLRRRDVLAWPRPLDVAAMTSAAAGLLGEHDFAAYCKARKGATTVRELQQLDCDRVDGIVVATVRADAFCHNMVRSLMGALIVVGEHRRPPQWPAEVLAARVRDPRVPVVDPRGLTLEEVGYPPDDQLAARAAVTRAVRVAVEAGPPR